MEKIIAVEENKLYKFSGEDNVSLSCFLNPVLSMVGRRYRMAVIVLPGGGYSKISERESDMIALRYQAYGNQAFVLRYNVGAGCLREALKQLTLTVEFVRENADRWDIDRDKVVLCGICSGAHLSLLLGCYWNAKSIFENLNEKVKPNALVLCYPVVTSGEFRHEESIDNCLMDSSIDKDTISIEKHINESFPPVFLWHNADDNSVSVINSVLLMNSLARKNVPFEAHIFPQGDHELSLCDTYSAMIEGQINEDCAQWFALSLRFLRRMLE